nr:reverse transcriptase domain-containing protein [Tanacetum cinerariifolium]
MAKDQGSQSMKEQPYNVDRDEDKSLTITTISMNLRMSVIMNSLRGRFADGSAKCTRKCRNKVLGTYVAKEENMIKYLEKVKSLVSGFTNFSISQVPRSKSKKADALSKIASISIAHLSKQVLLEILKEKSIQEKEVTTVAEEDGPTWMTPIMMYLKERTLPSDRKEARNLRIKAQQYELLEGVLYRRSFLTPRLRCVDKENQEKDKIGSKPEKNEK